MYLSSFNVTTLRSKTVKLKDVITMIMNDKYKVVKI